MRQWLGTMVFAYGLLAAAVAAEAKRVALVIGNGAYQSVGELANPKNDAAAVANALSSIGFDEVLRRDDLDQRLLLKTLREFAELSASAETAVVYFAGHGVEVDNRNYLVPTDATLAKAADVEFEAVPLDTVRTAVSGATRLRLVILDACRNNPFKLASDGSTRAVGRGLARVEASANEIIAYAAKEGTVAADGDGGNSPFAAALVKHLATPGLEVNFLFRRIHDDVMAATGRAQEPFTYGTLGADEVYLHAPAPASEPVAANAPPADPAALAWAEAKDTGNRAMLEAIVNRFPDTVYADFAKAKLADLPPAAAETLAAVPLAPPLSGDEQIQPCCTPVPADIWAIQAELQRVGCLTVAATGTWGPKTKAAATAFAAKTGGLFDWSSPNEDLLKALRAVTNTVCNNCPGGTSPDPYGGCVTPPTPEAALPAGTNFRDCEGCPEMTVLPAGRFTMGASNEEIQSEIQLSGIAWLDQEGPQHDVDIRSFAIGRFEVTRGEFQRFIDATGRTPGVSGCRIVTDTADAVATDGMTFSNPGFEQDDAHPAVCISWIDAGAYVDWLSQQTGKRYRLLTEAEWEYAARGQSQPGQYSLFSFGSAPVDLCQFGNGADQSSPFNWRYGCDDGSGSGTRAVGSYQPNSFGLYDMHGNVWEWVLDCYVHGYAGAPTDGSAWIPQECSNKVLRGGAWSNSEHLLRSAARITNDWTAGENDWGFRVARDL